MSIQDYINWLQRYIIVHSYIYYFKDDNFISDREYDAKSKELVALKEAYPEEWKNSRYYIQYGDDYIGNTGCDLLNGLNRKEMGYILSIVDGMYFARSGEPMIFVNKHTGEEVFRVYPNQTNNKEGE